MSPSWMLFPLHRHLRQQYENVELWDHPHAFSDPDAVVAELRERLSVHTAPGEEVAIVTHSFGDWVARTALESVNANVTKLVALCPVVRESPAARFAATIAMDWIPEIRVMADPIRASAHLKLPATIQRLVIWSRWDPWVRRSESAGIRVQEAVVAGSHNSVVFQPGVWKQITDFLTPAQSQHCVQD